jgi:trehalose 6-phosphate synthase
LRPIRVAERTLLGQLVIVSNRVAVPEKEAKARAGGLEVAVKAALKHKTGIWFGWSGKVATHTKIATHKVVNDKITYITLDLSKEDHHEYYNGFTNRVLWPILHYRVDLAEFSRRDLTGYLRVNDHFARELHKVLRPDDFIWVHDYHLMPLAKALRERGHKNRIGFFLHIPCPPPEILTTLPHHERLIPSLCEYDLIGFQTGDVLSISAVTSPANAACTVATSISSLAIGRSGLTCSRSASRPRRSPSLPSVQCDCRSLNA